MTEDGGESEIATENFPVRIQSAFLLALFSSENL